MNWDEVTKTLFNWAHSAGERKRDKKMIPEAVQQYAITEEVLTALAYAFKAGLKSEPESLARKYNLTRAAYPITGQGCVSEIVPLGHWKLYELARKGRLRIVKCDGRAMVLAHDLALLLQSLEPSDE